jgi:hypothetical protein
MGKRGYEKATHRFLRVMLKCVKNEGLVDSLFLETSRP